MVSALDALRKASCCLNLKDEAICNKARDRHQTAYIRQWWTRKKEKILSSNGFEGKIQGCSGPRNITCFGFTQVQRTHFVPSLNPSIYTWARHRKGLQGVIGEAKRSILYESLG